MWHACFGFEPGPRPVVAPRVLTAASTGAATLTVPSSRPHRLQRVATLDEKIKNFLAVSAPILNAGCFSRCCPTLFLSLSLLLSLSLSFSGSVCMPSGGGDVVSGGGLPPTAPAPTQSSVPSRVPNPEQRLTMVDGLTFSRQKIRAPGWALWPPHSRPQRGEGRAVC